MGVAIQHNYLRTSYEEADIIPNKLYRLIPFLNPLKQLTGLFNMKEL